MLFLGNSYTLQGPLDEAVEAVFAAAGEEVSAARLAEPGWRLPQHVEAIETDGSAWSLAFAEPQAWVVLQDQSQIPGFPAGQADLVASQEAAVTLDTLAAATGAQTLFLMTWGRRDGDEQNPELYPDYPTMQAALAAGYLDYAARASEDGTPAWVAPAGLAWARVYDDLVAAGLDPLDPTSPFAGLYVADGSHPSERGSYLAACVVYASVTGSSPVGLAAPEAVPDAAYLQAVAAAVVLDGEGIAYPWEDGSDTGGALDTGGAPTDPEDPPADDGGCGCAQTSDGAGVWAWALAVGLLWRRRSSYDLVPTCVGGVVSPRPNG
ncbi:MAG: MYXO-CTERM sorting domain-containing protein [Pseudomonadota bacterium]|nr:MYXO-CTERM sorting domain-containing protein [Pseudomonadota bacterium]